MNFDQIQRDIAAYRGGGQDASQMAAKGYRFLTPKRFSLAEGGEVNEKISMIKVNGWRINKFVVTVNGPNLKVLLSYCLLH